MISDEYSSNNDYDNVVCVQYIGNNVWAEMVANCSILFYIVSFKMLCIDKSILTNPDVINIHQGK